MTVKTTDFGYEVQDSTQNNSSKIPTTYYFRTVWNKDLQLIDLFTSILGCGHYDKTETKEDLNKLSNREKLAISRHRKDIEEMLNPKEKHTIKIIHIQAWSGHYEFYTHHAEEKEKIYLTKDGGRIDKTDCVLWSEEKDKICKLIEDETSEFNKKRVELIKQLKGNL